MFGGLLAFLPLLSHDAGLFIIAVRGPWEVLSSTKVGLGPYLSQYHSGKEYIGGGAIAGSEAVAEYRDSPVVLGWFFCKAICKALSIILDS